MWRCRRAGDPLERLNGVVNFEAFRYRLDKILKRRDRAQGGRPPSDCVLMFKVPVLQALDTLSDEQAEFQIRDRLSFLRFLGIGMCGKGPDATTIWLFREQLTEAGAMAKLLAALFDTRLRESGYLAMSGQIIDASLIAAPRQRHTEAEKAAIRTGQSAAEIGTSDAAADSARQRGEIPGPFGGRACLRPTEGTHEPVRPNHRPRPGDNQGRPRQFRLQPAASGLAQRESRARIKENTRKNRPDDPSGRKIPAINPPYPPPILGPTSSERHTRTIRGFFEASNLFPHRKHAKRL